MNLDLRFYWRLFIRRFPVMALLLTLCTGLAAFVAIRMPETYSTQARLLVEEPQIPDNMVASTVQTDAVEQLDVIQQRLLTRANMIDIANKFDVYEDLGSADPDEVLRRMRENTTVRRSAGRDRATTMVIQFVARDARIAANVVNEYVTLVLQENSEFRIGRAESALSFFEDEVAELARDLDIQGNEIAVFKTENAGALPEDQSYRLGRQSLLQERLSLLERDLRASVTQRDDIERIFDSTGRLGQAAAFQPVQSAEAQQLVIARADLELALTTYSETNPRVIRLQSNVDRLEQIVSSQNAVSSDAAANAPQSTEEALFDATIIEMNSRIGTLEGEIESTTAELMSLQEAITQSSANGIVLNNLERDYRIVETRYNSAVENLNEAQISERLELTGQSYRISILESASIPNAPVGAGRLKTIAAGGAVGLALAGGLFVLLEVLNRTVRRPAELVSRFGVTPITTIPYMESRSRLVLRRSVLVLGSLVALIGVPAALWYVDTYYLPLDLFVQKALERLGMA